MPYVDETSGLEVIPLTECVRLLEANEIGRMAITTEDGPRIYPVNYHWDGEAIVYRTTPDSLLAEAAGSRCAFEVDGSSLREKSGWSILALGVPAPVDPERNPETLARLQRLALYPYVEGRRDSWFRFLPAPMTGRRTTSAVAGA